jgi:predicted GIY-YIG superfamily endonuclease
MAPRRHRWQHQAGIGAPNRRQEIVATFDGVPAPAEHAEAAMRREFSMKNKLRTDRKSLILLR